MNDDETTVYVRTWRRGRITGGKMSFTIRPGDVERSIAIIADVARIVPPQATWHAWRPDHHRKEPTNAHQSTGADEKGTGPTSASEQPDGATRSDAGSRDAAGTTAANDRADKRAGVRKRARATGPNPR